jgi:hypothetical protein
MATLLPQFSPPNPLAGIQQDVQFSPPNPLAQQQPIVSQPPPGMFTQQVQQPIAMAQQPVAQQTPVRPRPDANVMGRNMTVTPDGLLAFAPAGSPVQTQVQPTTQVLPLNQPNLAGIQQPGAVAPTTGVIGSEEALQAGQAGAVGALTGGAQTATQQIQQGLGQAGQFLGQAGQNISDAERRALALLQGAGQEAQGLFGGVGQESARLFGQGAEELRPFVSPGQQANQVQAALSGALGPEAQAQAFANFTDSPGQQFLRDRAEQSLLRREAALGGLGGGRVRQALQEQAVGLAQQDLDRQFGRLGQVSGTGLRAAEGLGTILGEQARTGVGLTGQQAGLAQNLGLARAGLVESGGAQQAALNQARAINELDASGATARIAQQTGLSEAQVRQQVGNLVASGRLQAGRDISGAIAGATAGLAGLQEGGGANLANLIGQQGGNLANSLQQEGLITAQSIQNLSTLLANLATQTATGQADLASAGGQIDALGVLGTSGAITTGIERLFDLAGEKSVKGAT